MVHLAEFIIFKTAGVLSRNFRQVIRNPGGQGINFLVGLDWTYDCWQEVGANYVGSKGRVYSLSYRNFDVTEQVNNTEYREQGYNTKLELKQIPAVDWEIIYFVQYQQNNYQQGATTREQEYLTLGAEFSPAISGNLTIKADYGLDLTDNRDNYKKFNFAYDKAYQIKNEKLIYNLKAGLASSKTPLNYQTTGGEYRTQVPLRGQEEKLVATKYIKNSFEYHHQFINHLCGIVFVDLGKMVPDEKRFLTTDWELDGGLGIAYDTPLGPLRVDIALDNLNSKPTYNLAFGHTF